ncbi:histone-lysine N-methyltransferase ASHH1-like isoform X2 [Nymphaea colorata]|uniref:histone-lysine N-methyltransferase ASHH1-like isoform X2 n=1 Tax=Nymphaea colorata TaxID=210225 RepID=UPI00129DF633|nr:histone-lysine N-methyltransferase ASHH1-like isoform X2 [Nymphaea colorata]
MRSPNLEKEKNSTSFRRELEQSLSPFFSQDAEDMPAHFKHIERNEFLHRKHLKQKKQDIPICNCKYIADDPESACGERCLNVLTSTECTPGFCPCGEYCKNQVNHKRSLYD